MRRESGKIKVLVVDDPRLDGVSWWRNARPFAALDKLYGDALDIKQVTEAVDVRELMTADVVVRFRPTTKNAYDFLQVCKELGCKLILDVDDDLWHVPPTHPVFGDFLEFRERLADIYALADAIWVSTEHLLYSTDCLDRGEVMQNAVLEEELPERPLPYKGIAAWRGNDIQVSDITSDYAKKWYRVWADKYEHWIFAGYFPDLEHGNGARFVKRQSPLAYFLGLKRGFANVLWKPMQDNLFNDGKSNIALIEATMSGAACVTNYAGKPGWETALPEFTTDPEEIAATWAAAKDDILKNYNLREVTRRRFESIVSLVGQKIEYV